MTLKPHKMKKNLALAISAHKVGGAAIFLFILLFCSVYINAQSLLPTSQNTSNGNQANEKAKAAAWLKENKAGFVENKGQLQDQTGKPNTAVKYLLNMRGFNVQLRANGFSYDAYVRTTGDGSQKSGDRRRETDNKQRTTNNGLRTSDSGLATNTKYHRVDIDLQGTNPNAQIIASDTLTGITNVFNELGSFENIHSYEKITYKDIYPGIDLEFLAKKGAEKPIEYNFIVHPGADASQIKMRYNSGSDISLKNGIIKMKLAFGVLEEKIPASYTISPFSFKKGGEVAVEYKATKEASSSHTPPSGGWGFAFNIPAYDKTKTLVIDPTPNIIWATYYGGTNQDNLDAFDVDATGNIYVTGYTFSTNGIATAGTFQTAYLGSTDGFVAKFSASGQQRLWGTYFGGAAVPANTKGYNIKTDGISVYVVGATTSTGGIASAGTYQTANGGGTDDGFLINFSAANGTRNWGTYYGGTLTDILTSVAIAPDGSIVAAGSTASTLPAGAIATAGAWQTALGGVGATNGTVVDFTPAGARVWGTYYGGSSADAINDLVIDASGNIYIVGQTSSTSGIASVVPAPLQPSFAGGGRGYVLS